MGWDVVNVFKNEGRSGYTGEHKPGFEEMIKFLGGGHADVLIARHHDRLTRNPDDFARLMQVCGKSKIKISTYTGRELDLSTASGGFYGFMETGRSWYESAIRSQCVKDAVERNVSAGKRTGGGSRPFGYKITRHDLGEGARRRYRIIGEEIEPAEADAIKEAASRVLRGESIRSIAFDFNDRGILAVGGGRWAGSTLRRMLVSPRIAGGVDLRVGDCFNLKNPYAEIEHVKKVPCKTRHDYELFYVGAMGKRSHPTEDAILDYLIDYCDPAFGHYIGKDIDDSALDYDWLLPTEDAWRSGDRTVQCAAYDPNDSRLRESLRGAHR
jgi:DNA invertase Pin-like site-specific DNA recombinase